MWPNKAFTVANDASTCTRIIAVSFDFIKPLPTVSRGALPGAKLALRLFYRAGVSAMKTTSKDRLLTHSLLQRTEHFKGVHPGGHREEVLSCLHQDVHPLLFVVDSEEL